MIPELPYRAIYSYLLTVEGVDNLARAMGIESSMLVVPNDSIKREVVNYYEHYKGERHELINMSEFLDHPEASEFWLMVHRTTGRKFVYLKHEGLTEFESMNHICTVRGMWDLSFFKPITAQRYRLDTKYRFSTMMKEGARYSVLKPYLRRIDGTVYPISYVFFKYEVACDDGYARGMTEIYKFKHGESRESIQRPFQEFLKKLQSITIEHGSKVAYVTFYIEFPLLSQRSIPYDSRGEVSASDYNKAKRS